MMNKDHLELLFNRSVKELKVPHNEEEPIEVHLESGETLNVDMFLFAAGRNGSTKDLKLENVGIQTTKRETIEVNEMYQTSVPHIYAVGDVIGFPALASTSMDQGRVAVAHMFQTKDIEQIAQVLPFGVYTVPEISSAGITEEEAKEQGMSYCTGTAYHKKHAAGKNYGNRSWNVKVDFHKRRFNYSRSVDYWEPCD